MKASTTAIAFSIATILIAAYVAYLSATDFADYRSAIPLFVNLLIFAAAPWLIYLLASSVRRYQLCIGASYAALTIIAIALILGHSHFAKLTPLIVSDKLGSAGLISCFLAYAFKLFQKPTATV